MSTINPALPLIDLHRHIEGAIRLETVLDLAKKHKLTLPADDVAGLRPFIQVMKPQPGVMAFIDKISMAASVLGDYAACQRVAYESVEDAKAEGLDYVELRFSPWYMAEAHDLNPIGVVESIINGVDEASKKTGMKASLIGIISRTYGPEKAERELSALLEYREDIIAIDLAGDEANFPGSLFIDHLKVARDAGWMVTIHAGESAGAESVWQAIRDLGANRIGHAVRAVEDPDLLEYLAEKKIGIEANLTSNIQTSKITDYASHPLRLFLDLGILATINTDDPRTSGIDIKYEYEIAAPAAGLSVDNIHQAQHNSLKTAFLSDLEKMELTDLKSRGNLN